MTRPLNFESFRADLVALAQFGKAFTRRPLAAIQSEPEWDYQRSVVFLVFASLISGAFSGIFQSSLAHAIIGFIILPFIVVGVSLVLAVGLSALLRFVHNRHLETERVFQVVAMALFPFLIFRVLRSFAPPVTIIGLAATCALMIVGLTDRFQLPRRSVIKIISIIFACYLVYWGVDMVRRSNFRQMASQNITDDSLKVLDQEFKR